MSFGISLAAMAAGLMGGTAAAQDAEPSAQEEEIVVTGFRRSLAQAIDIKRAEVGAVDAIVAEDIADMPDANLSESIQRIPGVAITRDAGEGRQISVRGLDSNFTRIRINGMEAISTAGGTDAAGGTNRGRGFDFNVFASDLFNAITVRKTSSAETEEGSLGATVDLRTGRPFDYRGFTLAGSGQVGYNDLSESYDPRGAFLVSNTWGDFGALFSVAWSHRDALEEGASTVRWNTSNNFGTTAPQGFPIVASPTITQVNDAFHPRIPRYDIYEHEQERTGATASFQWRPSDNTDIGLDLLYAKFDAERSEIFLEVPSFSSSNDATGSQGMCVSDAAVQGGTLTYGVFRNCASAPATTGTDIRSEARFDVLSTVFQQATLSLEHDFSDVFRVNGVVGYASSEHENPIQTTILWDRNNIPFFSYDYRTDNRLPIFNYGSTNVTDPGIWTLSQIRLRPQTADNVYTTAYVNLEYDLSPSFTLSGGLNWKRFEFDTTEQRRDPLQAGLTSPGCNAALFTAASNAEACTGQTPAVSPHSYARLVELTGRSLSAPVGNQNSWASPDFFNATLALDLNNPARYPLSSIPALGNNRSVEEVDLGYYVQADWDTEIAGVGFRGNIGVRQVETDQTAKGFVPVAAAPFVGTVETQREYSDTLPSLNMVFEPMDSFLVRFAAAEVMARPGLGNLNPAPSVSVSGANRTITVGNPDLDPFRATSYDLSFEWYFAPESLVSLAFFRKEIDTLVTTSRTVIPNYAANPDGLPDAFGLFACGGVVAGCMNQTWNFDKAVNTPGGPVEGYEVGFQLPFTFLPGVLSDFGFTGNYTSVESDITYLNSTGAVVAQGDLTGLSRESWNATLYYEGEQLSARIAAAHRSDYLTNIPGRDANLTEATAGTTNIDAAAQWAVNENLTFTLEGLNLTDEVNDQYLTPDDRSSFYHAFGRSYFVGLRFKY
ncbi:tonB-dependent receptor [alpha proteobacterium U9-1i]|nr:tonB-dependent receptor [alpha proteobacterium U9-1i]